MIVKVNRPENMRQIAMSNIMIGFVYDEWCLGVKGDISMKIPEPEWKTSLRTQYNIYTTHWY